MPKSNENQKTNLTLMPLVEKPLLSNTVSQILIKPSTHILSSDNNNIASQLIDKPVITSDITNIISVIHDKPSTHISMLHSTKASLTHEKPDILVKRIK